MKYELKQRSHLLLTFCVFLLFISLWWLAVRWYGVHLINEKRDEISGLININGNSLTNGLNGRFALIEGLRAFIKTEIHSRGSLAGDVFNDFASGLYAGAKGIRAIQAMPGGVVRYVYPLAGNEATLGHDILKDPRSYVHEDVQRTIRTGKIALSNPYELRQGGLGVVGRLAVYKSDNSFWGLAVIVLDVPPLLDAAGITLPESKAELSLRDKSGKVFHGREDVFLSEPVIYRIALPDGHWELAGIPQNGWRSSVQTPLMAFQGICLIIVLLLTEIVYIVSGRQISLATAVRQRTSELDLELAERKQAEEALARSEENYRVLFREMLSGFARNEIICDSLGRPINSRYLEINPAFERITGLKTEEVVGRTILEVFPLLEPSWIDIFGRVALTGESVHFEKIASASGIWFDVTAFSPAPNQYACTFTDITERRRAEEELRKYREHLEELVRERTASLSVKTNELSDSQRALMNLVDDVNEKSEDLRISNEKLKDIDRLKSIFIASMSHELRTPLNSIIGFSSILMNEWVGPLTSEQKENIGIVLRSGKHLLALINDVIDISKIEADKIDIFVEEFDLFGLFSEAVTAHSKEIIDKGLDFKAENMHLMIKTDRRRLLQCVLNLVSNAVKFTEKGSILIRARTVNSEQGVATVSHFVEISVADTGIGISEDDLPNLFMPFMRIDSPLKGTVSGTGLGLYLTKKLVNQVLKGEVGVESRFGEGSTFRIVIPAVI
jgi:PAS domain S-box-containing protein